MSASGVSEKLGEQLLSALTQAEIRDLLEALWTALSAEQLEVAIAHLPPNTQATIQQLLAPPTSDAPPSSEPALPISIAKLSQTWSELWQEWFDVVAIASEDNGRYIEQEAHWEPPYFDQYTFAEDLDVVAGKMRSHVPAAFEYGLNPEQGFVPELEDAAAEIRAGLPDWMEIDDGIPLGEQVTYCLLTWEWLNSQAQGQDAFQFALRVREIETALSLMSMDDNELIGFLWELPEADQACLVEGITQHKETGLWKTELGNAYSCWHLYYVNKVQESSPEHYLENLRETISQKWRNGLPVLEDLLTNNNYSEGLEIIQETVDSLLRSNFYRESWTPETSLLVTLGAVHHYGQEASESEKILLSYWQTIAEALGKDKKVAVLEIQKLALDDCFDWEKMFKTFADISVPAKTYRALFQSWREYVIKRATPQRFMGYGSHSSTQLGWLHWLIDSIADKKKGPAWFCKKITKWMGGLAGDRKSLEGEFDRLRLLTNDLRVIQGDQSLNVPTFYEVVIRQGELSALDDASRRAYLQQFAPDDLWTQVIDYWRENLHNFVPDPRSAHKSNYTEHARWMTALKEVSHSSYEALLAVWEVEHKRRSNLWKAMKKARL